MLVTFAGQTNFTIDKHFFYPEVCVHHNLSQAVQEKTYTYRQILNFYRECVCVAQKKKKKYLAVYLLLHYRAAEL